MEFFHSFIASRLGGGEIPPKLVSIDPLVASYQCVHPAICVGLEMGKGYQILNESAQVFLLLSKNVMVNRSSAESIRGYRERVQRGESMLKV